MYIGLMSGTSLDGVDGVLTAIPDNYSGGVLPLMASAHVPFPEALRRKLMALQAQGMNEIERESLAANALAQLYAECVTQLLAQAGITAESVRAIGVHGQTIRHRPELGFTRQTNNPALLAELSGIDVVADFRSRDVAAGGQGAPLVPAFHQTVFGQPGETRVLVNVGGISNISVLNNDGAVMGFDTGPGNALLDGWIAQRRGSAFDAEGAWAERGTVIPELLLTLLAEPYFSLPPPKSTGRDLFNLDWLMSLMQPLMGAHNFLPEDIQATLTMLTAVSIADAIMSYAPQAVAVYVCGGGARNLHLMRQIKWALEQRRIYASLDSTTALGISPEHVEALAFAWLAHRFCQRFSGNLPAVTGARGKRVLGALYPA